MEQMQMLSIDKALILYELLKPHLSEMGSDEQEFLNFIGDIVESMRETDFVDYINSVCLLLNLELEEMEQMDSQDIFLGFMKGLINNNIFSLIQFCESLGL